MVEGEMQTVIFFKIYTTSQNSLYYNIYEYYLNIYVTN